MHKVVPLFGQQLALDEAWPSFTFDKFDRKARQRRHRHVHRRLDWSNETDAVISRIEEADLFRKLIDYVIDRAGLEYRIARAKIAAKWLFDRAKPTLDGLRMAAESHKVVLDVIRRGKRTPLEG